MQDMTQIIHQDDGARWYAVRTRSRFEATTSAAFRDKGFTEFLPTYLSRRQWSDRVKELRLPLFPGYVFCRFDASDQYRVLNSPGVVHIVGAGDTPLPIEDVEIDTVRKICESPLSAAPWLDPVAGQRVIIVRGPLRGVEGTFVRMKDQCRLVVSISLLRRSVSTELDLDWVTGAG
jgi:transcriptional antiterminator NusG